MAYFDFEETFEPCLRCLSTCRHTTDGTVNGSYIEDACCPNCGYVVWARGDKEGTARGYHPFASKEETGYFVDSPSGGYRTPAKIWIPPGQGKEARTWLSRFKAAFTSQ